jgi:putative hydrolase of the HAD superfamily
MTTPTLWAGFDLDDTLHHFRRAAWAGHGSVAALLAAELGIDAAAHAAAESHAAVVVGAPEMHFVKGLGQRDYRRLRYTATLNYLGHGAVAEAWIPRLLDQFNSVMMANLVMMGGAAELMDAVRAEGRRVAVISNGPQDRCRATLAALGLMSRVDVLMTPNSEGVDKEGGLLGRALARLNTAAGDLLYVGDSLRHDVWPAHQEGIRVVWLKPEVLGEDPYAPPGGPAESGEPPADVLTVTCLADVMAAWRR